MIKNIEKLNKEIDRLMTQKTKADAQKEVWENRLFDSIKAYGDRYGVDLSGDGLEEIKKKIQSEKQIVEETTRKEYEQSAKLVNLINSGDIKGAWKLLGVDEDEVKQEEKVEEVPVNVQSAVEAVEEFDDEDFYGEEEVEDEVVEEAPVNMRVKVFNEVPKAQVKEKTPVTSQFIMEDDDDEDEFIVPSSQKIGNSGNSSSGGKSFILDDEDEDDFGGFGSILAGSKFKV